LDAEVAGKLHAVIPVRLERVNIELQGCIELIERHTDMQVVTVGHRHPWSVHPHIPTTQGRDKFLNTDTAMRAACETEWVSDPFVWWMDDVFILEPAPIPDWHMGELPTHTERHSQYSTRKVATRQLLEAHDLPTLDYELHTPLLVDKALMLKALSMGGDKRTVYGNLRGTGVQHEDVKPKRNTEFPDGAYLSTVTPYYRRHRERILGHP
jgi:hypothetical protein